MRGCELCGKKARMHCESDQANLCWECDQIVHSANFLVSKHTRVLLCRFCQNPTPWMASGSKLGLTLSLCHSCSSFNHNGLCLDAPHDHEGQESTSQEDEDENEDEYYYYSYEEEEEEENGENQVVPWSPSPLPPPTGECSSSGGRLKRVREWNDVYDESDDVCQDEIGSSSFQMGDIGCGQGRIINHEEENSLTTSIMPSRKQQRTSGHLQGLRSIR